MRRQWLVRDRLRGLERPEAPGLEGAPKLGRLEEQGEQEDARKAGTQVTHVPTMLWNFPMMLWNLRRT